MLASVEALSCGTPVLVSREADLPFVERLGAGFVIDFEIEEASIRMHKVAADRAGFRTRARAAAGAHFMEEATCACFHEIIAGDARRRLAEAN